MKTKRSFLILPPEEDRIRLRNIFRLKGPDKIKDFMVQLEVELDSMVWKPVARYDLAHGFFHRDLIYNNGCHRKDKMHSKNLNEATIEAIDDLKQNLKKYLTTTGFDSVADKLPTEDVANNLEEAKQYLLHLVEYPEEIDKVPNKVHMQLRDRGFLKGERVTVIKKDSKTGRIIEVI